MKQPGAKKISMTGPIGCARYFKILVDEGIDEIVARPWKVFRRVRSVTLTILAVAFGELFTQVIDTANFWRIRGFLGVVGRHVDDDSALELEIRQNQWKAETCHSPVSCQDLIADPNK